LALNDHNRRRALAGVLPQADNTLDRVDKGYIWRYLWPEGIITPPGAEGLPVLEFASAAGGPYSVAGFIRSRRNFYRVLNLAEDDREGNPQPLQHWNIDAGAVVLELNPVLLSAPAWYFRIYDRDESAYYYLGYIYYQLEFDALLSRNQIVYHKINLQRITDEIPEPTL